MALFAFAAKKLYDKMKKDDDKVVEKYNPGKDFQDILLKSFDKESTSYKVIEFITSIIMFIYGIFSLYAFYKIWYCNKKWQAVAGILTNLGPLHYILIKDEC